MLMYCVHICLYIIRFMLSGYLGGILHVVSLEMSEIVITAVRQFDLLFNPENILCCINQKCNKIW